MVHNSKRRRHGLHVYEFGPVFRAVKHRLYQLVENQTNFTEAEALFKVLWRFENCRTGRPHYPEELNWLLINEYVNGPFSFSEDLVERAQARSSHKIMSKH